MEKEYVMTKEMIKAVRIVMGYNTDLRVSLGFTRSTKERLWYFLDENAGGLFGSEFVLQKFDAEGLLSDSYEHVLNRFANAVIEGVEAKSKLTIYR